MRKRVKNKYEKNGKMTSLLESRGVTGDPGGPSEG